VDGDGARPNLLRSDPSEIDCGRAGHPRGLYGVGVELVTGDDPDAVVLPVDDRGGWVFVANPRSPAGVPKVPMSNASYLRARPEYMVLGTLRSVARAQS
jgi:hypothetical protein